MKNSLSQLNAIKSDDMDINTDKDLTSSAKTKIQWPAGMRGLAH